MRYTILPSLFRPVASVQPIHVGTGDPASKGSRPLMFYDVHVQRCHMPTSGTHVLGLAC